MRFNFAGHTFSLHFTYSPVERDEKGNVIYTKRRSVTASVEQELEQDNWVQVAQATVSCSLSDKFNKRLGRLLAFQRLLDTRYGRGSSELEARNQLKSFRASLCEAFFAVAKRPRSVKS